MHGSRAGVLHVLFSFHGSQRLSAYCLQSGAKLGDDLTMEAASHSPDSHIEAQPQHLSMWQQLLDKAGGRTTAADTVTSLILAAGQLSRLALADTMAYYGLSASQVRALQCHTESRQLHGSNRAVSNCAANRLPPARHCDGSCCLLLQAASRAQYNPLHSLRALQSPCCSTTLKHGSPLCYFKTHRNHIRGPCLQEDCMIRPTQQLRPLLVSVADAIQQQYPADSSTACWQRLLSTYRERWHRAHGLLGLLQAPSGKFLGCMRAGMLLTVLRRPSPVELLAAGHPVELGAAGKALSGVLVQLRPLLSHPVWESFMPFMLTGADALTAIVPWYIDLLLTGPSAGAAGEEEGPAAMQQASAWHRQRQQLLLSLMGAFDGLADPLQGFDEVCSLLTVLPSSGNGMSGNTVAANRNHVPLPAAEAVSCIAGQAADAHFRLSSELLILMALLLHMRSAGRLTLGMKDVSSLSEAQMVAARGALQAAATCRWLCNTATPRSADGPDASTGLSLLSLSPSNSFATLRGGSTLATCLLSLYLEHQLHRLLDPSAFGDLGEQYSGALQRGPAAARGGAPARYDDPAEMVGAALGTCASCVCVTCLTALDLKHFPEASSLLCLAAVPGSFTCWYPVVGTPSRRTGLCNE